MSEPYFEVETPLGVRVRTTATYWARIVTAYRTDAIKEGEPLWPR